MAQEKEPLVKIYTKTGDSGETGLFGGRRVSKDALRLEVYGTVDELNSVIGVALTEVTSKEVRRALTHLQNTLFSLGSDLATPPEDEPAAYAVPRINGGDVRHIEEEIDAFSAHLTPLRNFILPGGSKGAAHLHVARTVCRRAERLAVALQKGEQISQDIIIFLNRVSDFLFVLARAENSWACTDDVPWHK